MRYVANYSVPDHDDLGADNREVYLQVNSAGFYEFNEPFGAMHRKQGRRDWYLSYNHSGQMLVRADRGLHVVEAGGVFLYAPHEEQYYGQENQRAFASYWVHFTGFGVEALLEQAGIPGCRLLGPGQDSALVELFERLIEEIGHKEEGYAVVAAAILMQIIGIIARRAAQAGAQANARQIAPALQRISRQYGEKLSVAELARECHLSASWFAALFRRCTGCSPQRYIAQLRLKKACELLRHTQLSVRQVAYLCGFEDQLYFSRLFRNRLGETPTAWRRRARLAAAGHDTERQS